MVDKVVYNFFKGETTMGKILVITPNPQQIQIILSVCPEAVEAARVWRAGKYHKNWQ
jgi:hypothetical protein